MKITAQTLSETGLERFDYRSSLRILVDDKNVFDAMDGEPEDATLSRDFNDCYKIPSLMRLAYEAGKNGEELEIVNEEVDDL